MWRNCTLWNPDEDRKSTRLNSSHMSISYAVFCLKKKKATGRGVTFAAREALRHLGMSLHGARVVVQGYGTVGSVAAYLLSDLGCAAVAASDSGGSAFGIRGGR